MTNRAETQASLRQKIYGILILVFAILFMGAVTYFIGSPLVRFASQPDVFRQWVVSHGLWGKLAYMGMVCLQVIVAIIPGEPFEIVAGYAFGTLLGTFLCILGQITGSLIVFFFVRRFGFRFTDLFFKRENIRSLRFLKASQNRDFLFLLIFMLPGTPKDLLCYFAGFTDMRLSVWLLICSVGRIPSVITSTAGGNALGTKSYLFALVIFLITALISAVGLVIYRIIVKKKNKCPASSGKGD